MRVVSKDVIHTNGADPVLYADIDVSEEHPASIFRFEQCARLYTHVVCK
jgi:hypothetical protein